MGDRITMPYEIHIYINGEKVDSIIELNIKDMELRLIKNFEEEELIYLQTTDTFYQLPLKYETLDSMAMEDDPFWDTLRLYIWFNDKKKNIEECIEAKKVGEFMYGHLKFWEKELTSNSTLKPMATKVFGDFFDRVDRGEIKIEERKPTLCENGLPF